MIPFNLLKGFNALGRATPMDPRFSHISDWIFDLDNCLYPAGSRLFELIDQRMTAYIEELLGVDATEARRGYAEVDRANPWASWQAVRGGGGQAKA